MQSTRVCEIEAAFAVAYEERRAVLAGRSGALLSPDLDQVRKQVASIRRACRKVANPAVLITVRKHNRIEARAMYRSSPEHLASALTDVFDTMDPDEEILMSVIHSVINPSMATERRLCRPEAPPVPIPRAKHPDTLLAIKLQMLDTTIEVNMNKPFLLIAHSDRQHPSLFEASDETEARNTAETILAQQQHVVNVDVLQLIGSCRRAVNVQWSSGPKEIPA